LQSLERAGVKREPASGPDAQPAYRKTDAALSDKQRG
jgi:hypothetical protein